MMSIIDLKPDATRLQLKKYVVCSSVGETFMSIYFSLQTFHYKCVNFGFVYAKTNRVLV